MHTCQTKMDQTLHKNQIFKFNSTGQEMKVSQTKDTVCGDDCSFSEPGSRLPCSK